MRGMSLPASPSRSLRWLLAAIVLLLALGLLLTLLSAADAGLSIWQRLQRLPSVLAWLVGGLFALVIGITGWLLLRLLRRPRVHRRKARAIDRTNIDQRLLAARQRAQEQTDARPTADPLQPLDLELGELDRRALDQAWYVALFGEISAGKSALLNALAGNPVASTDPRGGTTTEVRLVQIEVKGLGQLHCADVPGTEEWRGEARAVAAREEALRAHLVLYVVQADLTATQLDELKWLAGFGKPMLLVLNKADRYDGLQQVALIERLTQRSGLQVVAVSAGGRYSVLRVDADGSEHEEIRTRTPDVGRLRLAMRRALAVDRHVLEAKRQHAVLRAVDARLDAVEAQQRKREADMLVARSARKAVIGGMAAVAPGTDLVIQGVLATQMVRGLCAIYGRRLSEVQADHLIKLAGGRLRGSSALVLALVGNAAKAFPGLGTLGGGLLHAVAYGLIFASLGRALVDSLETNEIRESHVLDRFQNSIQDNAQLRELATPLLKLALRRRHGRMGTDDER